MWWESHVGCERLGSAGRQRLQCNEREAFLCCDSDEHSSCWGKVRGFCWYSAAVCFLAGHLTAQRALEREMMLLPPARRRRLPCHTAYAGRHKSYSVNKDLLRSTTSHSSVSLFKEKKKKSGFSPFSFFLAFIFLFCVYPSLSLSGFFTSDGVVNKKVVDL